MLPRLPREIMKRKKVDYGSYIKQIRGKEKKQIAEYVLASFEFAQKAYLIGMLISAIVSKEVSKRKRNEMEKAISRYIQ